MQISQSTITAMTLIAGLGLGLLPFSSAKCFDNGAAWDHEKEPAVQAAELVCRGNLQGDYLGEETRRACVDGRDNNNSRNGKKYEFTVWNHSRRPRNLGPTECRDNLVKEILGCDRGGRSEYPYFEFM